MNHGRRISDKSIRESQNCNFIHVTYVDNPTAIQVNGKPAEVDLIGLDCIFRYTVRSFFVDIALEQGFKLWVKCTN